MKFASKLQYVKHAEDFESLLEYDSEKITDLLEEFVNYLVPKIGVRSSQVNISWSISNSVIQYYYLFIFTNFAKFNS